MKNRMLMIIVFFVLSIIFTTNISVDASSGTTYNWTISTKGNLIRTQDAYLPDQYKSDIGLLNPSDLFFDQQDNLYIADTGNSRVVVYNTTTGVIDREIKYEGFKSPSGVFITEKGDLYVADPGASKLFIFSKSGEIREIEKPVSVSYSLKDFRPKKVAVDNRDNIYLVVEGGYGGIVQLNSDGNFLGYFASNSVYYSSQELLNKFFYDLVDKEMSEVKLPPTFSNLFVDHRGIVYSTTPNNNGLNGVKKHKTNGSNLFLNKSITEGAVDIYVDSRGLVYVASQEGHVDIYTSTGDFIYLFGSSGNKGTDIIGVYSDLVSLAVDSNGNVFTIDGEQGYLLSYSKTDYASKIYKGFDLFEEGLYEEAEEVWSDILKQNQLSRLANTELAKSYYYQQDYENASKYFRIAENKEYYSQSYWEIRNVKLKEHLPGVLLFFFLMTITWVALKKTNQKYDYLIPLKKIYQVFRKQKHIDDLLYAKRVARHPIDSFYEIRRGRRGTVLGATILFVLTYLSYMLYVTSKGFIFQEVGVEDLNITSISLGFFAVVGLYIICSYLVTSISDGVSGLKTIYIGTMYSMLPLIMLLLTATFLSHFLTYNETFIFTFTGQVGVLWTVILLVIGFQEIQGYEGRTTLKSILITLLFMLIFAIALIFMQMLVVRVYEFLLTVIKEVIGYE